MHLVKYHEVVNVHCAGFRCNITEEMSLQLGLVWSRFQSYSKVNAMHLSWGLYSPVIVYIGTMQYCKNAVFNRLLL